MNGKITLITPPDFFINTNRKLMFVNLTTDEQDSLAHWLKSFSFDEDLNFYVFDDKEECDVYWFMLAVKSCSNIYVNLDNTDFNAFPLVSNILEQPNVCYSSDIEHTINIFSMINRNKTLNVTTFLTEVLNG